MLKVYRLFVYFGSVDDRLKSDRNYRIHKYDSYNYKVGPLWSGLMYWARRTTDESQTRQRLREKEETFLDYVSRPQKVKIHQERNQNTTLYQDISCRGKK